MNEAKPVIYIAAWWDEDALVLYEAFTSLEAAQAYCEQSACRSIEWRHDHEPTIWYAVYPVGHDHAGRRMGEFVKVMPLNIGIVTK